MNYNPSWKRWLELTTYQSACSSATRSFRRSGTLGRKQKKSKSESIKESFGPLQRSKCRNIHRRKKRGNKLGRFFRVDNFFGGNVLILDCQQLPLFSLTLNVLFKTRDFIYFLNLRNYHLQYRLIFWHLWNTVFKCQNLTLIRKKWKNIKLKMDFSLVYVFWKKQYILSSYLFKDSLRIPSNGICFFLSDYAHFLHIHTQKWSSLLLRERIHQFCQTKKFEDNPIIWLELASTVGWLWVAYCFHQPTDSRGEVWGYR